MTTYEKIVKGATKVKVAAPKSKYIEPILMATLVDSLSTENFNTIMHCLSYRLQDSAWLVVYKALIVIHIMIREGDRDVVLKYLSKKAPRMLVLSTSNLTRNSDSRSDIRFITRYSKYLNTRVTQFEITQVDYVRDERARNTTGQSAGRLRLLTIEKGLLRECESVQKQIDALLKSNFAESDVSNDILLTAFRLLVNDLLALFQCLNEGVISILEHYFEMARTDATRALNIYRKFVDQTKYVIDYLRVAKHLEYATRLYVPTIKHAPTALASSLEEYLNDPNFEMNRAEYLLNSKNNTSDPAKVSVASKVATAYDQQARQQPQAQDDVNRSNSLVVRQSTYNPWRESVMLPQIFAMAQASANTLLPQAAVAPQQPQIQEQQQLQQELLQQQQQHLELQQLQQQELLQQQQLELQQQQLQQQQFQIQHHQTGTYGNPQPLQMTATGFYMAQQQPQLTRVNSINPFMQSQSLDTSRQSQIMQFPMATGNQFHSQQAQASQNNQVTPRAGGLTRQNTNPFLNRQSLVPQSTGNNPFKASNTAAQLVNNHYTSATSQPIVAQPTAGGLERLQTIPVFPQTQREAQNQYHLSHAHTGIMQQSMTGHGVLGQGFQAHESPSLI